MKLLRHDSFSRVLLLPALLAALPLRANDPGTVVSPGYINTLFEAVRGTHPALGAATSRADAARHGEKAIRTWEDPMFKFGGALATDNGPMLEQEGDLIYEWEQKIPLFGLPRLERRMAAIETKAAELDADFQAQVLRRDLAMTLFQVALLQREAELTREDLEWLTTVVADATERQRNGLGSTVEVLRARNEQDRRQTRLEVDQNNLIAAQARLNRLMNRSQEAPVPRLLLPPPAKPLVYGAALVEMALAYEPKLKVMKQEVQAADASARLAHRRRMPEVVASVEGRQFSGDGGLREGMFTVGLTLPWFNHGKYREERRREESRRKALEAESAEYELEIREEVRRLTASIDSARREAILYRDTILPRTRQMLETVRANWLAGRAMLTDLLMTRREWIEADLMQARAVAEQYRMLSELVLCCGLGDLDALERIGIAPDATQATHNPK